MRTDDLLYGALASDPEPDWVNPEKIAIPQADIQQRLFANMITLMSADKMPLPRFWYLPWGLKAAIVMTGDDHGLGRTITRFKSYLEKSPPGCSLEKWECNRAPLHLVLDEADAFAPQRPLPGQQRLLGAVEDLVRRGRARGIGVTLVSQRAAVLNKDVLTQAEVLVALRTIAPQDRDAIDAWIKVHGMPGQREELMASLPALPIGTAWFWSPGWLDAFQQVRVRRRETFDSSATPKVGQQPQAPKRLAEVDLEQLRRRIAATLEKAKAEDPRELRRRIADLEQALRARPAEERIVKVVERVEVPVLDKELADRLSSTALALAALSKELGAIAESIARVLAGTTGAQPSAGRLRDTSPVEQRTTPPMTTISPVASTTTDPDRKLALAERKILTALAQYPERPHEAASGVTDGVRGHGRGVQQCTRRPARERLDRGQ